MVTGAARGLRVPSPADLNDVLCKGMKLQGNKTTFNATPKGKSSSRGRTRKEFGGLIWGFH